MSNVGIVGGIANCLFTLGMDDDELKNLNATSAMLNDCKTAAAALRATRDEHSSYTGGNSTKVQVHGIRLITNDVIGAIDEMVNFISRAKAAGFASPMNPIAEIVRINEERGLSEYMNFGTMTVSPPITLMVDSRLADDLVFNLNVLLDLVDRESEGKIDLEGREWDPPAGGNVAQLSSFDMSLSGLDTVLSDEVGADLLSFLPDIDKIKRMRIRESLGLLNFKNRMPHVVFTANYDPDNVSRGVIVGWRRMPDASGYELTRHSVFDNVDATIEISNDMAMSMTAVVRDYVREWVLSFYDGIDEHMMYAYLDRTVKPHNFYTYSIKAFQTVRTDDGFMFDVDKSPYAVPYLQLNDISDEIREHVRQTIKRRIPSADINSVSPYPFLSKKFYGHDKYDWILAAMNVRAAIERGDDRATVRKYSYLGSRWSFIQDRILANQLFRPTDPNEVIRNIREGINTFGVSQVMIDVIGSTGLDLFFGPKEDPQESTFKRATATFDEARLGKLTTVLAAIDPDTATVDVSALVSNLLLVTQGKDDDDVDMASRPTEIDVPDVDGDLAEDPLQFVTDFDFGHDTLDLATFEGISEFVRTIRLFFDQSPNRTTFGASAPPTVGGDRLTVALPGVTDETTTQEDDGLSEGDVNEEGEYIID